jgi:hypothetical protein
MPAIYLSSICSISHNYGMRIKGFLLLFPFSFLVYASLPSYI